MGQAIEEMILGCHKRPRLYDQRQSACILWDPSNPGNESTQASIHHGKGLGNSFFNQIILGADGSLHIFVVGL